MTAYHRPSNLAEALALCARSGAIVIGGGTALHARGPGEPVEVVDLQALGLDGIVAAGNGAMTVGATATLQQLVHHEATPPVVRDAARRARPSTLRNQATVGGLLASGDPESELLAALLVYDAVVTIAAADGTREVPLDAVLAGLPLEHGTLVTAVTLATGGRAAAARVGRTTADAPIVAAVARSDDGTRRTALAGVAARPVLVGADLHPPGDHRGSGEYRVAMAAVLVERALEALE
ncbi:MAG TPA: FAD binding domain-containing protein [Acidimicrobiales bacterium]|nr:FAD binding domain-containing protein [Acidimicrobiales bacterium]